MVYLIFFLTPVTAGLSDIASSRFQKETLKNSLFHTLSVLQATIVLYIIAAGNETARLLINIWTRGWVFCTQQNNQYKKRQVNTHETDSRVCACWIAGNFCVRGMWHDCEATQDQAYL